MSVASPAPPVVTLSSRRISGGAPARRAVVRWAWRLFRREWRQQLLILLLVVGAVAAVVVGSAVAADTPPPADAGFGTAADLAVFDVGGGVTAASTQARTVADAQIRAWGRRFGPVQVIENEIHLVPGSTRTYQIRAQDPHGPFGGPMLQLVSGHYPTGPGEVALTPGLASDLHLAVGDHWTGGGVRRTVVGVVRNPQSLLDEFALVLPGQVTHPTSVDVLFDARGVDARSLGPNVTAAGRTANDNNVINPTTIVLALATVGMLLIALVSIGGFTVLAQRRMRSLGMLQSIGATGANVRLVLEANGVVVGTLGAVGGFALGLALWLAYRPHLEQSAHHLIPGLGLPWNVVVPAMVLAVLATFFAARSPARAVTRVPVVVALAGRPAPPRRIHRSLVPGLVALGAAFVFFSLSGSSQGNGGIVWVIPGFVAAVVGIILVAPFFLSLLARLARRAPVAVRLPLRELARYRARSGSALSAISVGVLIAVVVCGVAAARYANAFDYVGPNLASNQLAVWSPGGQSSPLGGGRGGPDVPTTTAGLSAQEAAVRSVAATVGATTTVELDTPAASLQNPVDTGRQWSGAIFVATPALLRAYGIDPRSIPSSVDVLSSRPGLAGSGVQLDGGGDAFGGKGGPPPGPGTTNPCPQGSCLIRAVVWEEPSLPTGTSAPNTVITESALRRLHVAGQSSLDGWMLQTRAPLTASQIRSADALAAPAGLSAESRNSAPTSAEIVDWATVFAVALALGILAMSIGLLRSETAGDLRTLTAVGASSRIRRSMTAVTAGGLALLGALLGTVAAYVALVAWFRGNSLEGGLSDLTDHVPWTNLALIVVAMPVVAAAVGWVLAGREPVRTATRPLE